MLMTRDYCKAYIERQGYKVLWQMGSFPCPGYYLAIPSGPWGRVLRGSLNSIYREVKR